MKILNRISGVQKYTLEIVVFLCGAVVMIFELVGSRVLGPYFGTSLFVWTSLIGIIMGSLSIGYYIGGKVADRNPSYKNLAAIIFGAAVFICLTILLKDFCLASFHNIFVNKKFSSILVSLLLFLPASVLLGMVSPYAVKLKMKSLNTSATTVGNLYAISTAGSIIGTFAAGFYLIPYFGTNKLLIILSIILVLISLFLYAEKNMQEKVFILVILIIGFAFLDKFNFIIAGRYKIIDVDTEYNRIWIYDSLDRNTNKVVKMMGINNENHSLMFLDSDKLANEYAKYYDLAKHFNPNFKKTLMFGGAGYSYPKYFLSKYKDATIDVVEIDPKVTELARKYFRLKDDPRMKIYSEDGRVFLNDTNEKYDVIFGDAFSSHYSVPYQLTTQEAVQKKYNILNDNGVVVLNIISSINGDKGRFLRAEYATYKSVFPQVYIFPVMYQYDGEKIQNIILVALKSEKNPTFIDSDPELNKLLNRLWKDSIANDMPILTDDYAPVDYYINNII